MFAQLHYWAALPEIVILAAASLILLVDLFVPDDRRYITYWLTQLALLFATCVTLTTLRLDSIKGYNGLIVDDMLADFLRIACFIAVSLMLFYSRSYMIARGLFRGDVFVLTLFALLGMQVMITGNNFLTLYLGLELMSLSLYALVAAQRDHPRGAEASMKYFVLGALASGMLLYGLSMIYGTTGSLDLDTVAKAIYGRHESAALLAFGVVFIVSGLAFKLAVVPYHMWVPDVYDGAPTSMTLLIGTAPKIAAFAMTLRILSGAMQGAAFDWQGMLIVLCVLSMVLGNLIAISQTDFKGLNQRSPWWAFIMLLVMFSLAGLPPTIGFYAKFMVIEAAVNDGFVWLAVIAVMTSLIGAFYYLRIVKLMYFDDPVETQPIVVRGDTSVALSANGLLLLILGVLPQQMIGLCVIALTQSNFP